MFVGPRAVLYACIMFVAVPRLHNDYTDVALLSRDHVVDLHDCTVLNPGLG